MVLSLLEKQHGCLGVKLAVFCFQGMLRTEILINIVPVGLTAIFRLVLSRFSFFIVINGIGELPLYANFLGQKIDILTVTTHFLKHFIVINFQRRNVRGALLIVSGGYSISETALWCRICCGVVGAVCILVVRGSR